MPKAGYQKNWDFEAAWGVIDMERTLGTGTVAPWQIYYARKAVSDAIAGVGYDPCKYSSETAERRAKAALAKLLEAADRSAAEPAA